MSAVEFQGKDLNGQRALVTGAFGGLGDAVMSRLRAEGAEVVGLDRVPEADLCVDVASASEVQASIASIETTTPLDIVVHCAGTTVMTSFDATTTEDWDMVMAVNARGAFNILQATLPRLAARGYGRVVTVASIAPNFGYQFPAYSASKAAVIALTKSAAVQYANRGVTVNIVSPGRMATPMAPSGTAAELAERVPVGRASQPAEVAAAVRALVGRDMGYVTGANLVCDGGMSCVFALHGLGPYGEPSVASMQT